MGLLVLSCFFLFVLFCVGVAIWAMRSLDHDEMGDTISQRDVSAYHIPTALWSLLAIPLYVVGLLTGVAVLAASAGFKQGREKALRLYNSLS